MLISGQNLEVNYLLPIHKYKTYIEIGKKKKMQSDISN